MSFKISSRDRNQLFGYSLWCFFEPPHSCVLWFTARVNDMLWHTYSLSSVICISPSPHVSFLPSFLHAVTDQTNSDQSQNTTHCFLFALANLNPGDCVLSTSPLSFLFCFFSRCTCTLDGISVILPVFPIQKPVRSQKPPYIWLHHVCLARVPVFLDGFQARGMHMFRHSSPLHVGVTCSSITPVKVLTLIMYFFVFLF